MAQELTQPKLKQLVKLLTEWEQTFRPDPNRKYGETDEQQPHFVEIISLIRAQVKREID